MRSAGTIWVVVNAVRSIIFRSTFSWMRHDKPLPEQVGDFVFEAAVAASKMRVYAAD